MMIMADGVCSAGDFDVEGIMIDVDSLFDEDSWIPIQSSGGDFTYENSIGELDFDAGNHRTFHLQSGIQMSGKSQDLVANFDDHTLRSPYIPENSDAGIAENSAVYFDNARPEPSSNMNTWFGNSEESYSSFQGSQGTERVTDPEMLRCRTSFPEKDSNCVLGLVDNMRSEIECEEASCSGWMDGMGCNISCHIPLVENSLGFSGLGSDVHNLSVDDISSYDVISPKSTTVCHSSDFTGELGAHCSSMQFCNNTDDDAFLTSPPSYFPPDFPFGFVHSDGVMMTNERDEANEFKTLSACSALGIPVMDVNFKSEQSDYALTSTGEISYTNHERYTDGSSFSNKQVIENGSVKQPSVEVINGGIDRKYSGSSNNLFVGEDLKQSSSRMLPSMSGCKHESSTKDEEGDVIISTKKARVDGKVGRFMFKDACIDLNASNQYSLCTQLSSMSNKQNRYENDRESNFIQSKGLGSHLSRVSPESIQSNSSGNKSHVDDDSDICILEDISQPACTNQYQNPGKAIVPFQCSTYGDSFHYAGVGDTRFRANDERVIFQAALQDLSQPKSEASLPDGVLAVPLLRHQRIALWWMIQKETSSVHCSGGILADDQGLGKTVSTIALILKEKPPSLRLNAEVVKKEEFETLDLDKDDDEVTEVKGLKEGAGVGQISSNHSSTWTINSFARGRPAGGTLVVCPTSVIRQWADELHKKVTNEANLSVLVYHGSARTKDPYELAKYDVILTTYAIVSMEVPKQPLVDHDDEDKRKSESDGVPPLGLSYGKKRKDPLSSGKKGTTSKKTMDASQFEAVARPLAKVGWFRVVLDEAQSIKNHRTQVARACWGLRAKRRWCLSGTPIQNAIDDLYSYFRFLRYDPYAVYKSFCSTIKCPIQKNPARGYKKLQAVLKTIMLRRTKGTRIDGEPIINLPPRVIHLKKIEFTEEERDFYSRLEADSRAQFKEYAAAGTVKQNYVNILLMLLRLRQACDHPVLVRGVDSNSLEKFSIEMAKQLPLEKQQFLLKCLEASLAICGICSDPPEDAVVSICGHVFCNQCICEHLSGDDSKCPIPDCKNRINGSSVFSKATLHSCPSDKVVQEVSSYQHDSRFTSYSEGCPYGSSKIRAALEVLQSLTKQQDGRSANNCLENSSSANATAPESSSGSGGVANSDERKSQIDQNKVVGEKAIVFSQWTRMLDLLEACLKKSSIQCRRLDGTMTVLAREKAVKDFNTLPEVSVMIMSLKAASLGLNMVAASRVLLLDLWWNPTTEDQAIDRAHRIGQTRPVTVSRLTVKDTVEDRILALQQKKREMVASAFGEDESGARQTRLTVDDLEYLFMV